MGRAVAWLFVAFCVGLVAAFPTGPLAETSTCLNLVPPSRSPHRFQSGDGSYTIVLNDLPLNSTVEYFQYTAGTTYTGTIVSNSGEPILGFLLQAVDPSGTRIGNFPPGTRQQNLACNSVSIAIADDATLTHSQINPSPSFRWVAPSGGDGLVDFRYTIVRARDMYFGPLSAASSGAVVSDDCAPVPINVTAPVIPPLDYRIIARIPSGCEPSECTVFAGINTNRGNPDYLDFYLEGEAMGWVAVGFTDTPNMFSADVIGCNRFNDTVLQALDTWNDAANTRSNSEDGCNHAYLHSFKISDGRIRCIISREIVTTDDTNFDLALNESLYLIYGFSNEQAANQLRTHGYGPRFTPQVSNRRINPVTGNTTVKAGVSVQGALTRFHGILMWISWPLLAYTGMFFAYHMRPALPNGEWFQVHRGLMVGSLFVALLGFFIIFVAQYMRQPYPGLINFNTGTHIVHFTFGLVSMCIHIANPLIALCRCKPDHPMRWIFNVIHGYTIGGISVSISFITIALGVSMFNQYYSPLGPRLNIFWLPIAYILLYTVYAIGYPLIMYGCCSRWFKDEDADCGRCSNNNKKDMELKDAAATDTAGDEDKPRKKPSKDSPIRWGVFIVFEAITVAVTIAMIVLIAL